MSVDGDYVFEDVIRTLRLWVAINVNVHEDSVWIDSYEKLESTPTVLGGIAGRLGEEDNKYGISIVYYDPQNGNNIEPKQLISDFDSLFGAETIGATKFVLYDIYDIKTPAARAPSAAPRVCGLKWMMTAMSLLLTAYSLL